MIHEKNDPGMQSFYSAIRILVGVCPITLWLDFHITKIIGSVPYGGDQRCKSFSLSKKNSTNAKSITSTLIFPVECDYDYSTFYNKLSAGAFHWTTIDSWCPTETDEWRSWSFNLRTSFVPYASQANCCPWQEDRICHLVLLILSIRSMPAIVLRSSYLHFFVRQKSSNACSHDLTYVLDICTKLAWQIHRIKIWGLHFGGHDVRYNRRFVDVIEELMMPQSPACSFMEQKETTPPYVTTKCWTLTAVLLSQLI